MHQLPSKCCQITGSPFSRQDNNAFGSFFETIKPRMNNELWQDRGLSQAAQLVFHAQVKQVKSKPKNEKSLMYWQPKMLK